jgi:hypothetical protein
MNWNYSTYDAFKLTEQGKDDTKVDTRRPVSFLSIAEYGALKLEMLI